MTDDANGSNVQVFTNENDADQAAWIWIRENWSNLDGPIPDDLIEALNVQAENDPEYFIWYETHTVDDSPVIRSAKAQLGDLVHHMEQMKGLFSDSDGAIQTAIDDAMAWEG